MKLNIRSKLLGGFALVLLLTSAVNVYGLVQMNTLAGLTESIYNHPLQVTRAVLRADAGIVRMHRGMKDVVLATDAAGIEAAEAAVAEDEEDVYEQLAIVEEWILGDEGKALIAETIQYFSDWRPIRDEVIALTKTGKTAEAAAITKGKGAQHVALLESQMIKLRDYAATKATGMLDSAQVTRSRAITTTTLALIVAILIGGVLGFRLSGSISRNVTAVARVAQGLAEGDLRQEVGVDSSDEVGQLARAMGTMIANWRGIIGNLRDDASQLSSTSAQVAASSEELARTTDAQTDQISRISSSMEEMVATIREVARNTSATAEASAASSQRARAGGKLAADTVAGLERADEITQRLRARSDEIGTIVNLIQDIAAQTNILALNAAIEAAGAGAAGARFDVVAEEIRKLAGRTTEATSQIAELISAVQADTQAAAETMAEGAALAEETGQSLADIVEASASVNDMVQTISTSTEQQSRTSEEVSAALETIVGSSQQTAASTRETAQVGVELANLAERLKEAAARFKV